MTFEETLKNLYKRLLLAYLHYDNDTVKAIELSSKLLKEVKESTLLDNTYKLEFERLFISQASKLYEIHANLEKVVKHKYNNAIKTIFNKKI